MIDALLQPMREPATPRPSRIQASNDPVGSLIEALPEPLQNLARRGTLRPYRKGTVIIEEGSHGDLMYLVLKGQVRVYSSDVRGREIVYGVYGPGDYFGEMSLDNGPRSASVITNEATVCAVLTRQTLREHIAQDPDFAFELMGRVIHRARVATQNARNMALLDVYARIVNLLNSMAQPVPGGKAEGLRVIKERMTHAEIAARVGCSREMVTRQLRDLVKGGYIKIQQRELLLLRKLPSRW